MPPAGNTERQRVPYSHLVRLNTPSVLLRLQREHMPIFWLDRLVDVPDLEGEVGETFKRWSTVCTALHYLTLPEEQRVLV